MQFLILELCCSLCHFKKMHKGHKLLEICDEESLRKENITILENDKEIEKDIKQMNNIKENIENEITKINKTYDKVLKEVTECFKKKHEKLIKEENELVENLQSEVTKIKEKLEFFFKSGKSNN